MLKYKFGVTTLGFGQLPHLFGYNPSDFNANLSLSCVKFEPKRGSWLIAKSFRQKLFLKALKLY